MVGPGNTPPAATTAFYQPPLNLCPSTLLPRKTPILNNRPIPGPPPLCNPPPFLKVLVALAEWPEFSGSSDKVVETLRRDIIKARGWGVQGLRV